MAEEDKKKMTKRSSTPKAKSPTDGEAEQSLFSRVVHITVQFTKSLLGQVAAYIAAVIAAVVAFQKLEQPLHGVPPWLRAVIILAPILLALTLHTLPTLLAERRRQRLKEIEGDLKPGYFSLAPRQDENTFQRADNKHNEVLQWIDLRAAKVSYLTGLSGSGKSSLLTAWVLPQLKSRNTRVITLRGYQDIVNALQKELTQANVIWQTPPSDESELFPLLERACRHIKATRLLIVIDQFEECLILQDRSQIHRIEQLFTEFSQRPIANLMFLLVFRSDYTGIFSELALPSLSQDENWKDIPPFTERAAREFMLDSGLKVENELLQGVLREAAEIEQTKGLVRPITINLCGLVLGRFATGIPRGLRPGSLIRGFLQESITLSIIREVAPQILPQLITPSVTKKPQTVTDLVNSTGLEATVVRGCLLVLGQTDRAIVRSLDATLETWEISHDFLVPLLDSILARRSNSLKRQSSAFLPWIAAAILVLLSRAYTGQTVHDVKPEPRFGEIVALHTSDIQAYQLLTHGEQTMPFPIAHGGDEPVLKLSQVYGSTGPKVMSDIQSAGKIVFHAVGSTGNTKSPTVTAQVADKMENDFRDDTGRPEPSFFLHLGDVIYSFGESQYYYGQFYVPYLQYPAPILAVAGNHDGMVVPGSGVPTLQAFLTNFCANDFHQSPDSKGIARTAQIQPGVYFTLEAPFVRVLVLYSNTLEGPGVISNEGGKFAQLSNVQLRFLEAALNRIKKENYAGAVIIAVHHDLYRPDAHSGSPGMLADLDAEFKKTGIWPHAVLTGHAHNYQRYIRSVDGMQIPFVVAGNGGHSLNRLSRLNKLTLPLHLPLTQDNVSLVNYDDQNYGFLRLTADKKQLRIEYQTSTSLRPQDSVSVDLRTRQIIH